MVTAGTIMVRDADFTPMYIAAIEKGINDGLEELQKDTLERIDWGFERGADAMGRNWAPLSNYTIERKGDDTKLVETGDMREAFGGTLDTRDNELEIYNDDWKTPIHEFGRPDQNIPRRPMLLPAAHWVDDRGFDRAMQPALTKSVMSVAMFTGGPL